MPIISHLGQVDHLAARRQSLGLVCLHLLHTLLDQLPRGSDLLHVGLGGQVDLQQQMAYFRVLLAELVVVAVLEIVPLLGTRVELFCELKIKLLRIILRS